MFHLGVGRSQIEWKLKVKIQISVFPWANLGQNDHSNPYIESTTVLSDNNIQWQNYKNSLFYIAIIIMYMGGSIYIPLIMTHDGKCIVTTL